MTRRIRAAISDPLFAFKFISRRANRRYYEAVARKRVESRSTDVFAEEWDNLIILDACRFDAFKRYHDLPGTLQHRYSPGAMTREFLEANFAGRQLHDTVYVTANPMFYRHRDRLGTSFHATIDVWQDDGWDSEHRTVLPETMTRYATEAAERFRDKRIIVHYIQPHFPFVGAETRLDKRLPDPAAGETSFWDDITFSRADISDRLIRRSYVENLQVALPHVRELMEALSGLTVVTSDHGNMLGERSFPIPIKEYGHPPGIYSEELTKVPWLVFDDGPRRETTASDGGTHSEDSDAEVAERRLKQLGYLSAE